MVEYSLNIDPCLYREDENRKPEDIRAGLLSQITDRQKLALKPEQSHFRSETNTIWNVLV